MSGNWLFGENHQMLTLVFYRWVSSERRNYFDGVLFLEKFSVNTIRLCITEDAAGPSKVFQTSRGCS